MEWLNIIATILTVITGVIAIYQFAQSRKRETPDSGSGNKNKNEGGKIGKETPSKVKPVAPPTVAGVHVFSGDDDAYQKWVVAHPQGFVVNTNTKPDPKYMPLHKATCGHISNFATHEPGAFTERGFIKACSAEIEPLREWAKINGLAANTFTGNCKCLSGLESAA